MTVDAHGKQRRGRRLAMTADELDAFLAEERTCRVATASRDGVHVAPLWFVWHGGALWLYSIVNSQRWADVSRDPRVAVVVDAGTAYSELRGVELRGSVQIVGEVPRTGQPDERLVTPERRFAQKYTGADGMHYDGRHTWLRLVPDKVTSWDFRKTGGGGGGASPRDWANWYVSTTNAGAYGELRELFAPEAVLLAPDGHEYQGPDEIARFYEEFLPTLKPQIRISSFFDAGAEAMFALSASVAGEPDEILGAVDHVTLGADGRAVRLVIFPRPRP
jgi:hypothetical protein